MKYLFFFLIMVCCPMTNLAQSTALYEDTKISSIYLTLPADTLNYLIENTVNERYVAAKFVFVDGALRDTLDVVGLRLRGNTSLAAQKKSFKVSFNAFDSEQQYQGVKKLNLRGQHNDPTMVREKLFYDVWEKAGMPLRRNAFVKLYINQEYRGLYTNMEEIDKVWLSNTYGDNDGNLYKCTWPAGLEYIGNDQQVYKDIMNNPTSRAYDLVTNETTDDYTRLVSLITALSQPVNGTFQADIQQILNVESVLKCFALDVVTGNWDDYFYNKNNYYLYDNPVSGRFEFFTFDTDNTFGVDWLNKDWAKRNCLNWQKTNEPRPLATKLLAIPAFKTKFIHYLDSFSRFIVHPDTIFPYINQLHNFITPAAVADSYRSLDYGYGVGEFHDGFTKTIDGHTPYGIKPFLDLRFDSTMQQIQGLISNAWTIDVTRMDFKIYPNPGTDILTLEIPEAWEGNELNITLTDALGKQVLRQTQQRIGRSWSILVPDLKNGIYQVHLHNQNGMYHQTWVLLRPE